MTKYYAADFEATVEVNETTGLVEVTSACLGSLQTNKTQYFQTKYKGLKLIRALDSFMHTVMRLSHDSTICLHNLDGYDHGFIWWWCLKNDVPVFGSEGDFYITTPKGTIRFFDTLNLLSTSIAEMGKHVGLLKGDDTVSTPLMSGFTRDTVTYREEYVISDPHNKIKDMRYRVEYEYKTVDRPLDKEFKVNRYDMYTVRDVEILMAGMRHYKVMDLLDAGINTKSNWAWQMLHANPYREMQDPFDVTWLDKLEKYKFDENVTTRSLADIHHRGYKGGYCYVNPIHKGSRIYKRGYRLDINSMYPWIYSTKPLPKSAPYKTVIYNKNSDEFDKYVADKNTLAYINLFDVKGHTDKAPIIKPRTDDPTGNDVSQYNQNIDEGFLVITVDEYRYMVKNYTFTFSNAIMFLYERDYELENKFKAHCDYWYRIKSDSRAKGEKSTEFIAKLMLNSVYGKLGQYFRPSKRIRAHLNDETVELENVQSYMGSKDANVAAAGYITAYGRVYLGDAINAYGDDFVYCDTDSIHILSDEIRVPVGDELGQFKIEAEFLEGCWLAPKTYLEFERDYGSTGKYEWHAHTAGNSRPVPVENFTLGSKIVTKRTEYAPGGRLIVNKPFSIGSVDVDLEKVHKEYDEMLDTLRQLGVAE